MPWDDDIDWNPGDPLYPSDPLTVIQEGGDPGAIPGGSGASFDWTKLIGNLLQGGGGSESGGGGINAGSLMTLLALLGGVGSGINAGNVAKQGGKDIKEAADKANDTATGLFDKAQANFAPYQAAGNSALAGLQTPINLASKFVSKGTPSNMGGKFSGAMSLAQLAKR